MAPAYQNRASAYLETWDRQSALADLEQSLELDDQSAAAQTQLGLGLLDLGRGHQTIITLDRAIELELAIAYLDPTIELGPGNSTAYISRGMIRAASGNLTLAVDG